MNLRLYDDQRKMLIYEIEHPEAYFMDGAIKESSVDMADQIGGGSFHEVLFDGVHIAYGSARLLQSLRFGFESDYETVEMHFALKGKNTSFSDAFDQKIRFEPHTHNIIYANGMNGEMEWENNELQIFEINLAPSFFKRFLVDEHLAFSNFRDAIEGGRSALLYQQHRPMNREMYDIIEQIMGCQRSGVFKRMFLEAKVIELLLLQLEQFSDDRFARLSLKKNDIEKIYAVREFIVQNLDSNCSLIDLAHQAGTNDFVLKKGFKELFGTTVFGFWNDKKMEQAKKLLTEQDFNVGEVSTIIGYKNQRHFSTAFKKKFGVLPNEMKKTYYS
ncbi:helix-turn-helix transcriptional regulator [Sphingobacterium corticibacter]|uniref:AraC family transcriptional regulator n=1 Tax=Sphingobacterium corticibacter TaxID=2171749 RepID=A0A2T8HNB7_9SPHI|nr:AraC family transcriptional regulator [Sphingobacterium corticibacter]PVH26944.1 AraC family transcriptional regulator [Sphingobacterium corticibacter]